MKIDWKQSLTGGNELMCIAEALRVIAEKLPGNPGGEK